MLTKRNDENYIISLCDNVLGAIAQRQHCFDFLRGDTGRRLPVDAFYEKFSLAIEYHEWLHSDGRVAHFDKPGKLVAGGISREEQRRRYDQRRRDKLPANGVELIVFDYTQFEWYGAKRRLKRNHVADHAVIEKQLTPTMNRYHRMTSSPPWMMIGDEVFELDEDGDIKG